MLFGPYHAVVRGIVRNGFVNLSRGKWHRVAKQFGKNGFVVFSGDHALGGRRQGREAVAAWFASLAHYFPDLAITPLDIVVSGGPWATTVATRFGIKATLPGNRPYENEGMQFMRIAWGSIVEDRLYEDTALLSDALARIDRAG